MTSDDPLTPEDIDRLLEHARGDGAALPGHLADEGAALREVADWLDLSDADELAPAEPPADLLDRIHAATGPAAARTKQRLSPSWLGRWAPAVAAAALLVAVAVSALWPDSSNEGFARFELAAQGGEAVEAEFRFTADDDGTTFEVRASGLRDLQYDVWVRTEDDGERHWIGRFTGDIEGTDVFETEFTTDEIERFWVTDPDDAPVLGVDID